MKPEKMRKGDIASAVKAAIEDAQDFITSEIAPDRERAAKAFDGQVRTENEENRSSVVSTKCRDAVRTVMPALMRVFFEADKPVEFVPTRPDAVQAAEQATDYAHFVLQRANVFMRAHDAFMDALVKKVGIWKVYFDKAEEVETDELTGLTPEQAFFQAGQPDVEVLEYDPEEGTLKLARRKSNGKICIDSVAPEDFFIDKAATCLDDCLICGNSTEMRVSDVVAMDLPGVTFAKVAKLSGRDEESSEGTTRSNYDDDDTTVNDPSMRPILLTEAYMRMDVEGTGVAQWYRFICGGSKHELLYHEPADENPYCLFEVDPEPHAVFGRSLVELLMEDQEASTSLMRGLLDNVHMVNDPRIVVVKNDGNLEDAQNTEIGALLQANTPNGYVPLTIPYTGNQTLMTVQYYDQMIEGKTGVPKAAAGLDANMLTNTSATAAHLADRAQTATIELMARILAEGGYSQAMRKIHRLARQHPDENTVMRLRGTYVPVDPTSWSSDTDVRVNVGLGNQDQAARTGALQTAMQIQQTIMGALGPGNPLVGLADVRACVEDLMENMGIYTTDRYFKPFTREQEMQMAQQAAQQPQQSGADPNAAILQAEQIRAQGKAQSDQMKTQADMQIAQGKLALEAAKARAEDDRKRDEMAQKLALEAAKIQGEQGIRVNEQSIRAQQAAQRPPVI